MRRRFLIMAVVGFCSFGTTAATTPTMGAWTVVWADCLWNWWSFEVQSQTSIDGSGPVYEVGVFTSWAAGCKWWTCVDEGNDEDVQYSDVSANVYHGNNGHGWEDDWFSGSASSYHWVEAEDFSDSGGTGDNDTSPLCRETR